MNHPYYNDTPYQQMVKVTHLLDIIINSDTVKGRDLRFLMDIKVWLQNVRTSPRDALTEPQARNLRRIIFRNYPKYKSLVPALPGGVKFEDEVRRLLKKESNPKTSIAEGKKAVVAEVKRFLNSPEIAEYRNLSVEFTHYGLHGDDLYGYVVKVDVDFFDGYKDDDGRWEVEVNTVKFSKGIAVRVVNEKAIEITILNQDSPENGFKAIKEFKKGLNTKFI
jgi:hypothetical protein